MKYGRDIGVFILFLFTIFTASAQDEGKEDAVPYKELKKHIPAECRGLHRVKDVDDLLLQMYNNLDNNCLFTINASTLESIWGLPVLDFLNDKIRKDVLSRSNDLKKSYNIIFIKKRALSEFEYINIEESISYLQTPAPKRRYGGSIDEGMFPKYLPKPQIIHRNYIDNEIDIMHYPMRADDDIPFYRPQHTVYKPFSIYYWTNSSPHKKNILIIATLNTKLPTIYFFRDKKVLKTEQTPWYWRAID